MARKDSPPIGGTVVEQPIEETSTGDGLPEFATKQVVNVESLRILFVGPPKFGKTTFFAGCPDALLLACEEGHKFIECHKIIIKGWEGKAESKDQDGNLCLTFTEAVNRVIKSNRFKFIIIDTIDALAKICSDHFLQLNKAQTLKDLGDWGVGHDIGQNVPVRRTIDRLLKTGRGLGLTTHQHITQNQKGEVVTQKKETSMPAGILKFVYPMVDVILHGELGGKQPGNRYLDRIIRTTGSDILEGGNRSEKDFPPSFIVPNDPKAAWQQFSSFLTDPESVNKAYAEYTSIYAD